MPAVSILQGLEIGWKRCQPGHEVPKSRQRYPKRSKRGLAQKLKVPKWVCRSPLANFRSGQPFFAIAVPNILEKSRENLKNASFSPLGLVTLVRIWIDGFEIVLLGLCHGCLWEYPYQKLLHSHTMKIFNAALCGVYFKIIVKSVWRRLKPSFFGIFDP